MKAAVTFWYNSPPQLAEIEDGLEAWEAKISDWAKRMRRLKSSQRKEIMIAAGFIRKLVAECWIHTIAARSHSGDYLDPAAFHARRIYRQIEIFAPDLAKKIEERLQKPAPSIAA